MARSLCIVQTPGSIHLHTQSKMNIMQMRQILLHRMIQTYNIHYKLHSSRLAFYKVQHNVIKVAVSLHHLHVPQAKHVGCRLEILIRNLTHRLNILQQEKMLQQGGSEPYKMELASDTLWTLSGITLISYMHIWLVEFKAILHKANFFLTLLKTLFI